MDYAKFQVAVVEIAHDGVPLTVANVVARMRLEPEEAEKKLDRMAKEGRLDLEVDENEGVVVYRVRGLSPKSMNEKLEGLRKKVESEAIQHVGTALSFGKPLRVALTTSGVAPAQRSDGPGPWRPLPRKPASPTPRPGRS